MVGTTCPLSLRRSQTTVMIPSGLAIGSVTSVAWVMTGRTPPIRNVIPLASGAKRTPGSGHAPGPNTRPAADKPLTVAVTRDRVKSWVNLTSAVRPRDVASAVGVGVAVRTTPFWAMTLLGTDVGL